jgi:hypothetical protein
MATYRQIVKVFIGSPSDASKERKLFIDAVDQVNRFVKIMGIEVEPLRWEDALPGMVRGQDRINDEYIRRCHLAVFILWKRWGSPTGQYSSGFEEEYELAKSLFLHTNRPDIFLYFRDIPDELMTNPDEQLKKVLDFRRKIEIEKKPFCCQYKTPRDWERKFKGHLHEWVMRKFVNLPKEEQILIRDVEKQPEVKPTPVLPIAAISSQWTIVDTPGSIPSLTKEVLNPNNQGAGINKIAITSDGTTMWAIVRRGDRNGINKGGAQVMLYRSTDSGISWTDAEYSKLVTAQSHIENGTFIWDLAVAPDDPNIIVVACADISRSPLIQEVWISTDMGNTWANTGWPPPNITAGSDFISAMDISIGFDNRMVLIGTRDGSGLDTNNLQIMRLDRFEHWNIQDASNMSAPNNYFTGDILAAKFSPSFPSDHTIVVVYCDDSPAHKGTWLATGTHHIRNDSTVWQKHEDHIEIRNADNKMGDSPRVDELIIASLELPCDFSGDDVERRRFYVSTDAIDRIPHLAPNRGVYRIDNRIIYTLMDNTATFGVANTNNITRRAASIAYYGACISGKLLVGEVLGYGNLATVPTWFTDSPNAYPIPCWYNALKPTTGAAGLTPNLRGEYTSGYGNAKVAWSRDGALAYVATSAARLGPWAVPTAAKGAVIIAPAWPAGYVNVTPCDESALGISRTNGETWNQLSLINTLISKLTDVAPSPDGATIYLASVNTNAGAQRFSSVWRSSLNPAVVGQLPPLPPLGYWYERVYTRLTALNCEEAQSDLPILRLAGYCEEPTGQIIGWAAQGTRAQAWSPDYGDYWANITTRGPIQDFAFESQTILYNLYRMGTVQKLPYTGTAWETTLAEVNTGFSPGHSIAAMPEGQVLVSFEIGANAPFPAAISKDGGATFSPLMQPLVARNIHVAFDPAYNDNSIIYIGDDADNTGHVYRINVAGAPLIARWQDNDMMSNTNNAVGCPNPGNTNGIYGIALAYTGGTLYAADGCEGSENSGVWRTLDPLAGIPKPGIIWNRLDVFTPDIPGSVCFTLKPYSLKLCGCCTLDTDTTLYAIDYRPYIPTSKMGMLWTYIDHTAKKKP